MELIKEIPEKIENINITYEVRKAARNILLNEENEIALLYVKKGKYHKLPGGGIKKRESIISALKRETKEEVGANINIINEIGLIIEYRNGFGKYPTGQVQISYCYYSKVVGKLFITSYTDKEISHGFKLEWVPFNKVLKRMEEDSPDDILSKYIHKRDLAFIEKALDEIQLDN